MDLDCVEVIDLAGTEQESQLNDKSVSKINMKNKSLKLSKQLQKTATNMTETAESTVTKHDLQKKKKPTKENNENKSIKKKHKCPHKKHRKRTKDNSKNKSLDEKSTFQLNNQIKKDTQMYISKKKRKHHHKTCKTGCEDDASVILSSNSVPKTIVEAKSVKNKCISNKKRRVKLGSMKHCNMQDLVITQDVELKQNKHKCFIEVNMNILSEKALVHHRAINRHKFMHCTVPKERIRPLCLRRNCSNHCHPLKKNNNDDKKRDNSASSMSSDLMYEDISTDSLQSSDEEIDTLIKRARERERKSNKKRRNKRKRIRTSTPLDVWTGDALSDVSAESIPTSIHSRVTMVLEAGDNSVYSPASFSPLTTTLDFNIGDPQDFEDLQFNEETIDNIPLPSMTPEHFKGYSDIDATQKINKCSRDLVHAIEDKKALLKIEPDCKNDAVNEHIYETNDNAVIDTSTLSSSPKIKTEQLDGESDIYIIN